MRVGSCLKRPEDEDVKGNLPNVGHPVRLSKRGEGSHVKVENLKNLARKPNKLVNTLNLPSVH